MKSRILPRQRLSAAAGAGFTLMEVMIVLLILSGIMVSMTQILSAARNTRDLIHNVQETELVGPAILDQIERDLRGLSTYGRDPSLALRVRDRTSIGLDADTIDFVTSANSRVLTEGRNDRYLKADMCEVGYVLRPNPTLDDFLELYRRESFGVDAEPFTGGRYTFLDERVVGLDVQVFEKDGPDEEPLDSWGTQEDGKVGLPARLEITLTIELSPRLVKEQLSFTQRKVTYKRIVRFPAAQLLALEVQPLPAIPDIQPPNRDDNGPNGQAGEPDSVQGGGSTGGSGDGGGGGVIDGGSGGNPFGGSGGGGGGGNPFGGG